MSSGRDSPLWPRLVAEPQAGDSDLDFAWLEVDLSDAARAIASVHAYRHDVGRARLIGASRAESWSRTESEVRLALRHGVDAVVFEVSQGRDPGSLVREIQEAGAAAVPTRHLDQPCSSAARLVDEIEELAAHGGWCAKIAYPAPHVAGVAAGLEALADCLGRGISVSVTPMETAWGRLAAAMADSKLVFAPTRQQAPDRLSARAMLDLAGVLAFLDDRHPVLGESQ